MAAGGIHARDGWSHSLHSHRVAIGDVAAGKAFPPCDNGCRTVAMRQWADVLAREAFLHDGRATTVLYFQKVSGMNIPVNTR